MRVIPNHAREILVRIWDWPFVGGEKFSDSDRIRFKELSQYFSIILAMCASGLVIAAGLSAWVNVFSSLVGVLCGHYLAGAMLKWNR